MGIAVCEDGAIIVADRFQLYWSEPEPRHEGRAVAKAGWGQGVLPVRHAGSWRRWGEITPRPAR